MPISIGQISVKVQKHCTICNCSFKRVLVANIYQNTPDEIEGAKQELINRAGKSYTCRICKSIINGRTR